MPATSRSALSPHVGGGAGGSKWVCLLDSVSHWREEGENGEREEEAEKIQRRVGKKKDPTSRWDGAVIFIKNVPRGSGASYVIVALTAAKLRLHQPKSRPWTAARCASIKAATFAVPQSPCGIVNCGLW